MRLNTRFWTAGCGLAALTALIAIGLQAAHDRRVSQEKERKFEEGLRESSRTHHGPVEEIYLKAVFAELPPFGPIDGVRFLAAPTCAQSKFALSLFKDGRGSLVIFDLDSDYNVKRVAKRQVVNVSPSVATSVLAEFDKLAPPWPGNAEFVIHGTEVAFERKRDGRIFAGSSNTSGYAELASAVRAKLFPYVPELAKDKMWYSPGC
jgi:hypothetical protein